MTCILPIWGFIPGSVTSISSFVFSFSEADSLLLIFSKAAETCFFILLANWPAAALCSLGTLPISLSIRVTCPFLPRYLMRNPSRLFKSRISFRSARASLPIFSNCSSISVFPTACVGTITQLRNQLTKCRLGLCDYLIETSRVSYGNLAEHFTIQSYLGFLQAVDKFAVAYASFTTSGA